MTRETRHVSPACPKCGAAAVPILYGEPEEEAFEAEKRGELALGGCIIETDDDGRATNAGYRCKACRNEFGRVEGLDIVPATARTLGARGGKQR